MTHPATATLKSTGETVHKLADDARSQAGGAGLPLCNLDLLDTGIGQG